ncbi:hypothetical protein EJ02DRAFT_299178, partial [Clathrospora elynae]
FKPLSSQYSAKLTTFIHKSMGLLNLKKGDFFGLFWAAWIASFKKETILKSFEACGIWPKNSERVLKRFTQQPPSEPEHPGTPELVPESDWKKTRASVMAVVKEGAEKEAKQLIHSLHHFQVQNSLLEQENQGLRESLGIKKKRQKHGRTMDLVQEGEHNGGAVLWSPRKFREAGERQLQREQAEEQEKLHKADMKKLKANNALYKKKIAEEKR